MNAETLYQALLSDIERGKLRVHKPMPTEAELAKEYRLARGTVRAALQRLAQEGYIQAGQGRKRVVQQREPLRLARLPIPSKHYQEAQVRTRGSRPLAETSRRRTPSFGGYLCSMGLKATDIVLRRPTKTPCYALAEKPRFDVPAKVSAALGIADDSEVIRFLRLRLADDKPIVLQWAVIPAQLVPELLDDSRDFLFPGGLTALYEQHGIERECVHSAYSATRASKQEATYLRLGTGDPLIEERRVSYFMDSATGKEIPYEYLVSLYTERVALTFDWQDPQPQRRGNRQGSGSRKRHAVGSKP